MRLSRAESRPAVSIYDEAVRFLRPLGRPTSFDSFPQVAAAHSDGAGGLVLAGRFWADGAWQGGLRHIGAGGEDDLGFGVGGVAALPTPGPPRFGWARTIAEGVVLDHAGGYVLVGRRRYGAQTNPRDEGDAAAVWRIEADGAPDLAFGEGGLLERPRHPEARLAQDAFDALSVADDGQLVVGGAVAPGPGLVAGCIGPRGWASEAGEWSFAAPPEVTLSGPTAAHAGRLGCVWWVANTGDRAPRIGAFRR